MVLRKISFPLALAAILAGCTAETEFNPTLFDDSDETASEIDDGSSDGKASSEKASEKSSSSASLPSEDDDTIVVDEYKDLPNCSAKREGVVAFVKAEKIIYTCEGNAWTTEREPMKPSSSSSSSLIMPTLSSSSVVVSSMSSSSSVVLASSSSVVTPRLSSSSFIITPPTTRIGSMSWSGELSEYRVKTGFDNGSETSGYWYAFADHIDGGMSTITWPVEIGYSSDALDPVIEECGGVCGEFKLDAGTLSYKPFVGVAFDVAGRNLEFGGEAMPADASVWGGLCITYTSDITAVLELSMGEKMDSSIVSFDIPFVMLPKAANVNEVCKSWDQFKQAGWGTGKLTGGDVAANLATVRFKIQGADGTTGRFNVISIRSLY